MDAPITKRLIISGLTPSITADDISRRLTTFGTVKAADGFGLADGLGDPRKYGYVTLETTVGKLAKCMNLLSGSTWKGAKLRFGEAKPDFREKIALENKQAAEEPPKKKRKRFGGIEAEDMTLVSPENAVQQSGWKVSSLGRITRPVKMRPTRPITDMLQEKPKPKATAVKFTDAKKSIEGEKKKKKRAKDPDTRTRRRTIDMTKYGSTHLKGVFLDLEVPASRKKAESYEAPFDEHSDSDSDNESARYGDGPAEVANEVPEPVTSLPKRKFAEAVAGPSTSWPPPETPVSPAPAPAPALPATTGPAQTPIILPSNTTFISIPQDNADIQREKARTLNLLASLFGDNEDDWAGQESVDSDIDVDGLIKGDRMLIEEDETGFEIVPRGGPPKGVRSLSREDGEDEVGANGSDVNEEEEMVVDSPTQATSQKETHQKDSKPKTLKDLFAPREEEAGFSLLGHLDLDIELDDELPFVAEQAIQQQPYEEHVASLPTSLPTPITVRTHASQAPLVLDPKKALFFPLPSHQHGAVNKARQRDVYDLAKDNGWNWRDPAVGFYRTGTEEDIRKRWEGSKGELTREWKRRHREAGKVNRRKRGGVDGDEY